MVQGIFDDLNPETRGALGLPGHEAWDPERNTREFVAAMAEWRRARPARLHAQPAGRQPRGLLARASPGTTRRSPKTARCGRTTWRALERILDEADRLGMVVILGPLLLRPGRAPARRGGGARARWTRRSTWVLDKGYRNVLVEINNECDVSYDHAILQPARVHELIARVQAARRAAAGGCSSSTSYGGGTVPGAERRRRRPTSSCCTATASRTRTASPRWSARRARSPATRPSRSSSTRTTTSTSTSRGTTSWRRTSEHASWGFFDYRMKGEGFDEGYQSVPVNWGISSARKRGFFTLLREMTGGR